MLAGFSSGGGAGPGGGGPAGDDPPAGGSSSAQPRPQRRHGQLPLSFEPNRGQTASQVQFLSRSQGYHLGLAPDRATLILHKPLVPETDRAVLRWQLLGADVQARGEGLDPQPGRSNYLRGRDPRQWQTDVPHFGRVAYRNVYPGIDLVYYGTSQRQLEFDFVVAPQANPGAIELSFQDGVVRLEQGRLVIETLGGPVFHEVPVLYQRIGGARQPVAGGWVLRGLNRVGFQVGAYDPGHPLYIDPVLNYSSYLGGSGADDGQAVAVDTAGNTYLTGSTDSPNFPSGGLYSAQGGLDAFVTKLDSTGTVLLYSTYLGGSDIDEGRAIAVDVSGNAYVTGRTRSTNFPLAIAYQGTLSGAQDAFVVKLNAAGNDLLYSTYLGGGGANEEGRGISVNVVGKDLSGIEVFGNIFVTGLTDSGGATPFPTTASAYRTTNQGGTDAFVAKLNPLTAVTADQLVYSTYLGGAANDEAKALAIDNEGKVYVTGLTASTNFPTVNPYQPANQGGTSDAFVAKIDPTLSGASSFTYGSYLGGSSVDEGRGIAVDVYQQVYVAGHTTSSGFFHPMSGYQTTFGGVADAFVAKLDLSQSGVLQRKYQTFLGGDQSDSANAIAVDGYGNAYVTGQTAGGTFPLQGAWQGTYGGGTSDAFVTQLNVAGSALVYSSYLGGSGTDIGRGIAASFDGQRTDALPSSQFVANAVVTGMTASTNFPTSRSFQGPGGGASDAFVSRVSLAPGAPAFTGISPDTGISNTDRITQLTFGQPLTLNGTADPGNVVTISQSGKGVLGTATANGSGVWSYIVSGANNLPAGVHAFTAQAAPSVSDTFHVSEPSATFLVTIDNTAPTVTLRPAWSNAPSPWSTTDVTPEFRVTASDLFGLPNGAGGADGSYKVRLEVDGNPDYATATLQDGYAFFAVTPALSVANHDVLVRVKDKAGNEQATALATLQVTAAPTTWPVTGEFRSYDPLDGDLMLQTGNVRITHDLDLDQSPGSASFGQPALVYNSETVDVRPIVQAAVQSRNDQDLPGTITVTLTWDGTQQTPVQIGTTGRSKGELIAVAAQVGTAVTQTRRYPWTLEVRMDYGTPVTQTVHGIAYVVAQQDALQTESPYGAGWSFSLTDRLIDIPAEPDYNGVPRPAGKLRLFGAGGWRFYQQNGSNWTSPAGDPGTLTYDAGTSKYTYRSPDGEKRVFDSSGRQESWTSATADDTITFAYQGASTRLATVTMPDNGQATFSYTSDRLSSVTAPGSRTYTVTRVPATNKVSQIGNPDSNARTFAYSSDPNYPNNIVSATLGATTHSWAYGSHGRLTSYTAGSTSDGAATTTTITPAAVQGLAAPLATSPPVAKATDGLGHVTRTAMDLRGRLTQRVAGDGGLWTWTRDATTTWVTGMTDALGRTTSYERDGVGYVTLVTFPEDPIGTVGHQSYTYDDGPDPSNPRHRLIAFKDERNYGSAFQYTYTYYTVAEGDTAGGRHLKSVTNPLSQTTQYAWDWTKKRLQTITNARSYTTVFETDGNRRVNNVREADNDATSKRNTTLTYVSTGNGTGEVQSRTTGQSTIPGYAKPSTSNYTYDLMNRLTQLEEAAGAAEHRRTNWTYDPAGHVLTVTTGQCTNPCNPQVATVSNLYDSAGRLYVRTEASGTPFRRHVGLGYDAAGNLATVFDPRNRAVVFAYDGANRVAQQSEATLLPQQRDVRFGYDLVGNRTSSQDSLGRVTQSQYSNRNRLTRLDEAWVADPLNSAPVQRWTTFTYDAAGNLTQRQRGQAYTYLAPNYPHPITDEFQYDRLNRVERWIEALGTGVADTTDFHYDQVGNMDWVQPHAQAGFPRTEFSYDGLNRRTATREAATSSNDYEKRTTTFTYDAADNFVKREVWQADASTRVYRTDFAYDLLHRATTVTEAVGQPEQRSTTMLYDAASNLLETTEGIATQNQQLLKTRYVYDLHNRRTKMTEAYTTPKARTSSTAYDDMDQMTAAADPLAHTTRYGHDDLSRHTHTVDALDKLTKFTRDAANNVVALTDPVGNTSKWVVDALNRVTKDIDSLGNAQTYKYDATSNLTQRTDRNNRTINWGYDEQNRPTSEDWVGGNHTVNWQYNVCDCLTDTIAGPGGSEFSGSHDALDRPRTITVRDPGGLMQSSVTFYPEFHANNVLKKQRVQINSLDDHTDTHTSDFLGRITQIRRNLPDGAGGAQLLKVDLAYNSLNELKEVKRYDGTSTTEFSTSTYGYDEAARLQSIDHKIGVTSHATYTLAYDAADRMTQQVVAYGSATTTNYGYDATNQLTSESIVGGATTNYSYDANGNRTTGYTTGQANRLTTDADGYTYTYDAEGNVTVRQKSGDYQEFEWNYHNLLTRATFRDAPGGTILKQETYRYDVFDRRIGKTSTVGRVTTEYQFVWDDDQVVFAYTKVGAGPVELTDRYLHGPAIDQVLADEQLAGASGRLWALTDHLGSVRDVVNTTASVKHRVYDAFGRQPVPETGSASFLFGYTGREFDAVVGLQYNRARYYDARIGRWMSEDPIRFRAGDANLFRYVGNRPLTYTDPVGLDNFWLFEPLQTAQDIWNGIGAWWNDPGAVGGTATGAGIGATVAVTAFVVVCFFTAPIRSR